jgi:hypothetical protein
MTKIEQDLISNYYMIEQGLRFEIPQIYLHVRAGFKVRTPPDISP